MRKIKNIEDVYESIVSQTAKYITENGLKSMILGISGGIDSTVVAAIASQVSLRTGVPLIGRSLPTKTNENDEVTSAKMVGEAFCDDFKEVNINELFNTFRNVLNDEELTRPCGEDYVCDGNIKARCRMIYLYHLASINRGLVLDSDNISENLLGFYTIHGDSCDLTPIGGLWKHEIYELADFIQQKYSAMACFGKPNNKYLKMSEAIRMSMELTPTDGNGVKAGGDMAQIAPGYTYNEVDDVLYEYTAKATTNNDVMTHLCEKYDDKMVNRVIERYRKTSFKRKKLPIVINLDNTLFIK